MTNLSDNNSTNKLKLAELAIILWALLVISADLKDTIHPQIHWFVSLLFLFPVILKHMTKNSQVNLHGFSYVILFLIAIIISGFRADDIVYTLEQCAKLSFIILIAYTFFITYHKYAHIAFKAFIGSVYLNLFLLLLGYYSILPVADLMTGDGRWGNILNYPGSLVKTGIIIFVYALYCFFVIRPFSIKHLILIASSAVVIFFDGSRTGAFMLIIACIFTVLILLLEHNILVVLKSYPIFTFLIFILGIWVFYTLYTGQLFSYDLSKSRLFFTVNNLFNEGFFKGLEHSDASRFIMIKEALSHIQKSPFIGTGLASTQFQNIVVHNTYLQIWADIGLLGIIAYILFICSWLFNLKKGFVNIKKIKSPELRGVYYCSIFMLFYFIVNGIFHPLSTEWSEWILFIVYYSLFLETTKIDKMLYHH